MDTKPSSTSIGTASGQIWKVESEGPSAVQLSGVTGQVRLDSVKHVPKIAHSLISVGGVCDDGLPVQFTKNSCDINMQRI